MKKAYLAFAVLLMVMVFVSGCTKEYDSGGSADSLEAGEDPSKALYTAIKEHDLKATEPAVGEGADVNSFSQNVKSEMKEATGAARTSLRYALERGSLAPDIVELLVDKGADVDYADPKNKETYLMYCASKKKPGLADLLLENGTDVNTQDADGKTALSFAIFGEYLKNNDIDRASRDGVTMLMAAASCGAGNVVDLLIEEGADVYKLGKDGNLVAVKAQEYREYDIFEKLKNSEGKSR